MSVAQVVAIILISFVSYVVGIIDYTNVDCVGSNKTIKDYKCYIREYGAFNHTLNVEYSCEPSCYNIMADIQIKTKKTPKSRYRTLWMNKNVDICGFLGGKTINPALQWMINITGKTFSSQIHACPYLRNEKFLDISVAGLNPFSSRFPAGLYRLSMRFFNKRDDYILDMNIDSKLFRTS